MTTNVVCSACGKPDDENMRNRCQCTVESLRHRFNTEKAAREKAEERMRAHENWFAEQFNRIGVSFHYDYNHEAEPAYLKNDRAEKAERERDALELALEWMNRKGGLGPDIHDRIDAALAELRKEQPR